MSVIMSMTVASSPLTGKLLHDDLVAIDFKRWFARFSRQPRHRIEKTRKCARARFR